VRNKKPIHIVFIGGSILFSVSLILLTLFFFIFGGNNIYLILISALTITAASIVIFYFLLEKYIESRIKILYRIIRKGKTTTQEPVNASINSDIIEAAEIETEKWASERSKEIAKLKEQEEFRKEFLGNLAHELKTPVFSIQGYILTLLEGGLEDKKVNRTFLERASKATDRIASLLEDLDEITKMEIDRFEISIKPFDIADLAKEVLDSLEIPASNKNISLSFNKDYHDVMVKGDRAKIAQVLTNLVVNSINYGHADGKTTIRFYVLDDVIMTEVSDNGPGISDNDLPRLFERFYRVEQSRNRNEGGSGLGLAIVKHIIDSHNQTINVRSTLGVGSTFSFTLEKSN
jgi:two-component system, OmpR family, phosphate regulon sensor histidine kinase PhoR